MHGGCPRYARYVLKIYNIALGDDIEECVKDCQRCRIEERDSIVFWVLLFPLQEMILNDKCTEDARGEPDMF